MSESFFFIQNHRFLLPDLEHMDSQEIHISSVPRPYNARHLPHIRTFDVLMD